MKSELDDMYYTRDSIANEHQSYAPRMNLDLSAASTNNQAGSSQNSNRAEGHRIEQRLLNVGNRMVPSIANTAHLDEEDAIINQCQLDNMHDPDYNSAVKLKVINHGNCDFCEVPI